MCGRGRIGLLALVLLLAASMQAAFAGKGGGGMPGGGGGGPPADPAILWTDTVGRSGSTWQVLVANDDGTNVDVVVPASAEGFSADPCGSPAGTQLVYRGDDTNGEHALFVVDLDGTNTVLVHAGTTYRPRWSPTTTCDGTERIVFSAPAVDTWDLYAVTPTGQDLVNLTGTPGRHETWPTWSPDGTRIAARYADYAANGTVTGRGIVIYTLSVVGGALTATGSDIPDATLGLTDVVELDWSRTGNEIACAARAGANDDYDIWVIDILSPGTPTDVTSGSSANERWPTWSPDDARIAYTRIGKGKDKGIYVQAVDDQGSATRIVGSGKHFSAPDWLR